MIELTRDVLAWLNFLIFIIILVALWLICWKLLNITRSSKDSKNVDKYYNEFIKGFAVLQPLAFLGSLSLILASFSYNNNNTQVGEFATLAGGFLLLAFACSIVHLVFMKNTALQILSMVYTFIGLSCLVLATVELLLLHQRTTLIFFVTPAILFLMLTISFKVFNYLLK